MKHPLGAKRAHRHPRNIGALISTFTFILFAIFLGMAAQFESSAHKAGALYICTAFSCAGASRFIIATLWAQLARGWHSFCSNTPKHLPKKRDLE